MINSSIDNELFFIESLNSNFSISNDSSFRSIGNPTLKVVHTELSVDHTTFVNSSKGIYAEDSKILITDSQFSEQGEYSSVGGALSIKDPESSVISNSTFDRNIGLKGGAISLDCKNECLTSIQNSTFELNEALIEGGAIWYNRDIPNFLNNSYLNNTAKYGQKVGSYPVKFLLNGSESLSLSKVSSG